jgi:arginine/ornithine transport system permease protein
VARVAGDVCADPLLLAEASGTAAAFYFTLTFSMVGAFKLLDSRFLRHLQTVRRPAAIAKSPDPEPLPTRSA